MLITIYDQSQQFIFSAILGIIIMLIYDFFRVIRFFLKPTKILLTILDIIFWIAVFITSFLFVVTISGGFIRWFVVIGAFIGSSLYRMTLSNFLYKYSILFIKGVYNFMGKIKKKGQMIKDEKKDI